MDESYIFPATPIINKKHVFFGNEICDLLGLGSQEEFEDPSTFLRCGRSLEVVSGGPEPSRVTNDR